MQVIGTVPYFNLILKSIDQMFFNLNTINNVLHVQIVTFK